MSILTHDPWCHISVESIPTIGLLGHRACAFTTLKGTTTFFLKGVVPIYSYTAVHTSSYCFIFLLTFIFSNVFFLANRWF